MKQLSLLLALATWLPVGALCGTFTLDGEALYWLPVECGYTWAHVDPLNYVGNNSIPTYTVSPDYDWGFRVGGAYEEGCLFAEMSYLHHTSSHLQQVTRDIQDLVLEVITDTDGASRVVFMSGNGQLKHRYENIDLRLGVIGKQTCRGQLAFFVGARWIDIEEERRARGFDGFLGNVIYDVVTQTSHPEFWGIGPQVGFSSEYALFQRKGCLSLYTSVSLMALIGESQIRNDRIRWIGNANNNPFDLFNKLIWQSAPAVSPGIDFEIGFSWEFICGCWNLTAHVGYEIDHYLNALQVPTGDTPALSGTQQVTASCIDIGFAGLTFGLAAGF